MTKSQKVRHTTEGWLPVKGINNGMIITPSGNVAGVKILPKNIFILESGEQEKTLFKLKDFYNQIDYEFWLIAIGKPVDITGFLSYLQVQLTQQPHPMIRKMIKEDIAKAEMFIKTDVIDTEYYILFKDKNVDLIQKRIREIIGSMIHVGLAASQASNDDLRLILDSFFNDGKPVNLRMVLPK